MKKVEYNITTDKGFLPPQEIEIEQAILGGMLIDSRAVDEVMLLINTSEVFYKEQHQVIFDAIQQLANDSKPIDALTVANKLRANGTSEIAGGDFYVAITLTQKVASTANIDYHCRIVLEKWVKRKIIAIAQQQISDAYKATVDIFDLLADAEKGLDHINEMLDTGKSTVTFSNALQQVVERVEMLSNQKENEVSGVTTGFKKLDVFTGGWQAADLVVVGARPGMGKTSFILKNLLEIALKGDAVGMFSLEMSIQQLATRLVAINSEFHLSQLFKKGFEHDKYFLTLNEVVGAMEQLNIHIDDSAGISIQQLQMKARMWKRKYNIKALFVDYLQLMSGDSKNGNREQEISLISRKLKQLAKELDMPVIGLSQLGRSVETRGGDKRTRLSDLRESGAIEQDADTVLFIFRPEYYNMEVDPELFEMGANTEIQFAKYRAGSLETKGLWWQGDKTKFMDPEDKPEYFNAAAGVQPNNEVPF